MHGNDQGDSQAVVEIIGKIRLTPVVGIYRIQRSSLDKVVGVLEVSQ